MRTARAPNPGEEHLRLEPKGVQLYALGYYGYGFGI